MTNSEPIPHLSGDQLSSLGITTSDVIGCIERLIRQLADGKAWSAPKAVMLPDDGRYLMASLAATDDPPLIATKSVVLNPSNPEQGLPQVNGLVTVLNSRSGLPVAILDAKWVTAIRTAGLSATAAVHMANDGSSVVAFIGCGVQARSHLQAFSDLFPLREIRLLGRGQANIDALCHDAVGRSLTATVCDSGEEALSGADLVVSSVTYSAQLPPFLDAAWLKPGCFATITDLAAPWHKESFSALDQVVIDDLEQEAALPNKLVSPELVTGDLSGMVLKKFAGRTRDRDRNAFVFRGHAMGDLALSVLACRRAGLVESESAGG